MIKFSLKFTGNTKKLLQAREVINDEFLVAMTSSQLILETDVAQNTPTGVGGTLKLGIHGKVIDAFHGIVGVEGAGAKYGDIVEMGRRAKPISKEGVESLRLWVIRKLQPEALAMSIKTHKVNKKISEKGKRGGNPRKRAIDSVTYLVARKIRKKGFKGKFMFRNAERKLKNNIIRMFEDAKNRVERLLSD